MRFSALRGHAVNDLIQRFAAASEATVVVGAGASMEALLPSWPLLIERLLRRVAAVHPHLTSDPLREQWIQQTLREDDLLAAGAIVEVMASDDLDKLLPEELFSPGGPGAFEPGPIAHQVASLKRCFGADMAILTTNYDDLIERALLAQGYPKKDIKSYVRRRHDLPPDAVPVTHLHGYAGRGGAPKRLVLTEEHYHRMQRGTSWQERYVTERLETSLCLFVGTSLADPNLIRYLYGYKQSGARRHAAVFVRQSDAEEIADGVQIAREDAVARRWGRCGVEAIFVDHYADAAQLLCEIGLQRAEGDRYQPFSDRAARSIRRIERQALNLGKADVEFADRQVTLSRWLRVTLQRTLRSALGTEPPEDEKLALALWLLNPDGSHLTGWAHSDRAHQDPATIEAVPVRPLSPWVAVRTVCQGVRVELDRDTEVSRWRFIRGLPLVINAPNRLPIGCLTISSTKPGRDSILVAMPQEARTALHEGLLDAVLPAFERVAQLGA